MTCVRALCLCLPDREDASGRVWWRGDESPVSRGVCRGCSQSISRSKAGRACGILSALTNMVKLFTGQPQRPDLEAIVASGLFEECVDAVAAVGAAGTEGLHDTHHATLVCALSLLKHCRQQPGCEARIRSLAPALAFCLENDLDVFEQVGTTTASNAAQICESIYSKCELRSVLIHSLHMTAQAAACLGETKAARNSPSRSSTSTSSWGSGRKSCEPSAGMPHRSPPLIL